MDPRHYQGRASALPTAEIIQLGGRPRRPGNPEIEEAGRQIASLTFLIHCEPIDPARRRGFEAARQWWEAKLAVLNPGGAQIIRLTDHQRHHLRRRARREAMQ